MDRDDKKAVERDDSDDTVADEPPEDGAAIEAVADQSDDTATGQTADSDDTATGLTADSSEDRPAPTWGAPTPRLRRRSRALTYVGVIAAVVAVVLLVGSVSAFAYDKNQTEKIVPDMYIGTVLVGGLTRDQAVSQVARQVDEVRARTLTVKAYDKAYAVSLGQLDVDPDIESAVDAAFESGRQMGLGGRITRWLAGGGSQVEIPLDVKPSSEAVEKRVIANIAGQVNREPTEAAIDESSGNLVFRAPAPGIELDSVEAAARLNAAAIALSAGSTITEVSLPAKEVAPPKEKDVGAAILVRVSEQKLYYYENGTLAKTFKVSTGTGSYPTPLGRFRVIRKIMNPSWSNPSPNGWGKDMPAHIGPGPGNPLGTRALELNSPGILIHGTTKVNLLGSPASHGCVRMAGSDIEGLFPQVPEDTPVFIRA